MENIFEIIDWEEYVNPDYVELKLSNGKKLQIRKKSNNIKSYNIVLTLLDNLDNPKAKKALNKLINQMVDKLNS